MIYPHVVSIMAPTQTIDSNRQVKKTFTEAFKVRGYFQSQDGQVKHQYNKAEVISTHVLYCEPNQAIDSTHKVLFGKLYDIVFIDRLKNHMRIDLKLNE